MKRPATFSDIIGHDYLVTYFTEHIKRGTLHHFLILDGPEGLGKTSFADVIALSLVYGLDPSPERTKAYTELVIGNASNDYIKRFKCSVDGGKDAARMIKDEMHATFNLHRPKVIICDECHGLTEAAQDLFLAETEFLDEKVYVIMLTTEVNKLKASLRSRAVPIHLNPLKSRDMVRVLQNEVVAKALNIQNESATLQMIAEWADNRPRTGLNILNAFANGSSVSMDVVRELIGYMDVRDVVILLSTLSGSMTYGLSYISDMVINQSIVSHVIEILTVKSGQSSYKLKLEDVRFIREQLVDVTTEQIVKFLHGITKQPTLTRQGLINAYITAHSSFNSVVQPDTSSSLADESIQRANIQMSLDVVQPQTAPTLSDLLMNSDIIGG